MSQFKLADNVKETTTTTGTGTLNLLGAFSTSMKTFVNGIGTTKLTAYKIDDGAGNWECRYGVITSGTPDTLTNAGFISSTTGSAVSFLTGTKTVTCVPMPELVLTAAVSAVLAETSIASATTTDLGSIQTLLAQVTGTTTITGFGTSPYTLRIVRFAAALTLTYNATSLILPTSANITTVAGDKAMFVSDVSGNWTCLWYQRASGAAVAATPLQNYLTGLALSTAGSSATFSTAAGQASDTTNVDLMVLAASISKTTSAWAVGSGNGGLDTGAIANSTWYHVYLIKRADTGVVDVLFSTSASSPTMPTNYTLKRRIGSMLTNGSAQWTKFTQNGDEFLWDVPLRDVATSFSTTAAVLTALSVPLGVQINALFSIQLTYVSSTDLLLITSPDQADSNPASAVAYQMEVASTFPAMFSSFSVRTNTSKQIRLRSTTSGAGAPSAQYGVFTFGWLDTRGK